MKKLIDENYVVPNKEDSTVGINIHKGLEFPCHKDNCVTFRANLWDFGGQEIQYMLHQFFLTSRSLYVLLVDDRKQLTHYDYWFHIISLLGGNSPVLVVLNEISHKSITNFDVVLYRKLFSDKFTIEVLTVDLSVMRDGRFKALRYKIENMLSDLKHIGDELPAQWIPIRKELESISNKNHIHINEYFDICRRHKITKEDYMLLLSGYLHDLGIILHYQKDEKLYDMVVLNPHWAVDAVYIMLSSKYLQEKKGVFEKTWLFKLWEEKGYNFHERGKLLNLMLKDHFEICYAIGNDEKQYIAPLLLPTIKPEYQWDDKENLQFRFQYPFMPEGIITRLIVRLHEFIEKNDGKDVIWRTGTVLQKEGNRAQVTEETSRKDGLKIINISISGVSSTKRDFLTIIRNEVEQIHRKSFPSIEYSMMIPCICEDCKKRTEPDFFEYGNLIHFRDNLRKTTRECSKSGENVLIDELINGVMDRQSEQRYYDQKIYWKIEHEIKKEEVKPMANKTENKQPKKSVWIDGLFFVFLFIVVLAGIGVLADKVSIYTLPIVLIAGLLFVSVIGALVLRNDEKLSSKSFTELMKIAIKSLPLLRKNINGTGSV